MKRLSLAWTTALASLTAAIVLFTLTVFVAPPGKFHSQAARTLHDLISSHLGDLDQRLWAMDQNGGADACEFTWRDNKRVGLGLRTFTFTAHFQRAAFDPIREDWVTTCDDTADFYALELTSTFTGAYAPRRDMIVIHRFISEAHDTPPEHASENTVN